MPRLIRFASLLAVLILLESAWSQEPAVTEDQVRKAIALFQKDPFALEAKSAGKEILLFALQSKQVAVVVDKEETEWFLDKKDEFSSVYMTAYFSGNILAQLNLKRVDTDVYAGLREVLRVYQLAKKKSKDYSRPALEKFLALEKEGKLQAALADVQKKRTEMLKDLKPKK